MASGMSPSDVEEKVSALGKNAQLYKVLSVVFGIIALVAMAAVIWLDIATSWWQETVILSGIAAGLLTFVLTALFVERAMSNREHRKWAPVTRLALSDLLHSIADDNKSDIRRGKIVARSLPTHVEPTLEYRDILLAQVVAERNDITTVLARWAQFLASSADVLGLMVHIADLAESLDDIRDETVEIEESIRKGADPTAANLELEALQEAIRAYNRSTKSAIDEILAIQKKLDEES